MELNKTTIIALLNVPTWQDAKRPKRADFEGVLENSSDVFQNWLKVGGSLPHPNINNRKKPMTYAKNETPRSIFY